MKRFILCSSLLVGSWAQANAPMSVPAPARKLRICYISMNNEKEFHVTRGFVDKLQRLTGKNWVEVAEYLDKGGSPEKTLEKMIESKQQCDGLVISGHHTGSFGGTRAQGSLTVEFMERVSCTKDKSKWFENVNSLWLQGCRTLGAPGEMGENNVNLAEFHANRVNAVREEDGLEQNQMQLAQEFSDLLDTQTPYATRFMKSFPQARLYGWTRTAPGEKRGSERSLLFHVHNMAIHSGGSDMKNWIKNPLDPKMTIEQADIYLQALMKLLQPVKKASDVDASLKAWDDHGKPSQKIGTIGFDNDDLASMPPLFGNGDATLPQSRELECKLRSAAKEKETVEVVKKILDDPRLIALTFYTLKDVISKNSEGTSTYRTSIVGQMKNNTNLMNFLQEKLKNQNASLVRKLEYYGFLNLVDSRQAQSYAAALRSKAEQELLKEEKSSDYEARDYKVKIIEESIKSKLISIDDIHSIYERTQNKVFGESLLNMIAQNELYLPDAKIEELVLALGQSLKGQLGNVLSAIRRAGFWNLRFETFVEKKLAEQEGLQLSAPDLEKIMTIQGVSSALLNKSAEMIVASNAKLAESKDDSGYSFYMVKSSVAVFLNPKARPDLRDKAVSIYVNVLDKYLALNSPMAMNQILNYFDSNTFKNFKSSDLSEDKKDKLRGQLIQLLKQVRFLNVQNDYGYSRVLNALRQMGGNNELISEIVNSHLKTPADLKRVRQFLSDSVSDETEFLQFDIAAAVKALLASADEYDRYILGQLIFKGKMETKEFHALFDEVLKASDSSSIMSLLIEIGTAKFLPTETKKFLTQKVLKKNPHAMGDNEFIKLAVGFLNPHVERVTSNRVMEILKGDPNNIQLKVFYAIVWISERPQLQALPVQLDAYLNAADEQSMGFLNYFMQNSFIKPEILRDLYLKLLDVNSFEVDELGEFREQFRGQDDELSDFKYKDVILKKIDEKLTQHYQ